MSDEAPPEPDRQDGAPHPRDTQQIFGHANAEATLLDAYNAGRMHHAWLISGPRGVGKATLAWRFARFLLATPMADSGGMFAAPQPDSFDISGDLPVARRMLAMSEPGLFLLRRPWDDKLKRHKTELTVDEVRGLKSFFQMSAGGNGRRVVIVDSADDMNRNAANALLKELEEPPKNATLILISHQPSGLLPTIRSRCRSLRLGALSSDDLARALDQAGVQPPTDANMAELAGGSVGEAVRLAALDGPKLYADLVALFSDLPRMDRGRAGRLADACVGRGAEPRFDLTLSLLDRILSRLALTGTVGTPPSEIVNGEARMLLRLSPTPHAARNWADTAQGLTARARRGKAVNLDPAALVFDMFLSLERTAVGAAA